MPRKKPSDITQIKIRVREDLRRALEAAAKKRDVSINFEMTDQLRRSFDQGELDRLSVVATNFEKWWEQVARDNAKRSGQAKLIDAAEYLIRQLPPEVQEGEAVRHVQEAIKAITDIHGRTYHDEPPDWDWEKKS